MNITYAIVDSRCLRLYTLPCTSAMSAGLCSGVVQVHTWVAIADWLEASSNAQEGAIPLGPGVVQVSPPLALYPASEQELCEKKRACTAQGLLQPSVHYGDKRVSST